MTLLYLALAFMIGVAIGRTAWDTGFIGCDFPAWLWIAFVAALPFTSLLNRLQPDPKDVVDLRWPVQAGFRAPQRMISYGLMAAVLLSALAGFARYGAHPLYPCGGTDDLRAWHDPNTVTTIRGTITSYPTVRDTTQRLDIQAYELVTENERSASHHELSGLLRVETDLTTQFHYGQQVRVSGKLVEPWTGDGGAYKDYLARRGIYSQMQRASVTVIEAERAGNPIKHALYALRSRGEAVINRMLPAPYAALASGMLLGIESGIPRDLMDKFRDTGTSHVIVISGSNVALIAGVLAGLFARLMGKRYAWIPVAAGITGYALLVGGDMAVLRASLMGGLAVTGAALGRTNSGIIGLAAACLVLLLINPLALWDVGFQLSAAATAGLIIFTPPFASAMGRLWPYWLGGPLTSPYRSTGMNVHESRKSAGILRGVLEDSLVVSLAASVAVLPLLAYTFGRVSAVGLLANLLIVPVQPLITVVGSAGALIGAVGAEWLAQAIIWIAWPGLWWTVTVVEVVAALPFASLTVNGFGIGAMAATYAALLTARYWRTLTGLMYTVNTKWRPVTVQSLGRPVVLLSIALTTLLIWWGSATLPDGRLHVTFLDIGQGDGIFIQTPSGRQILVDGGSSPQRLMVELGEVMPFWDRTIDLVVLTHPDGDHMDAQIQAPNNFEIGAAITTQAALDSEDARAWQHQMARAGIPVTVQAQGGWIDMGDGVGLWTLNPDAAGYVGPDPDNENSLTLKLVYDDFSVLLTGDAGLVSETEWLDAGMPLETTVLKVGHHGSNTSTGSTFVEAVSPEIAVIQVGADNTYGHPHESVLAALNECTVLRNDIHGRIHLTSDGDRYWVETERTDSAVDLGYEIIPRN